MKESESKEKKNGEVANMVRADDPKDVVYQSKPYWLHLSFSTPALFTK